MLKDAVNVPADICVGIAHRRESPMFVQRISRSVTAEVVSVAVHLHDESLLRAKEVYDAVADDVLSPELVTTELRAADTGPELRFERRHLPAQALRSFDQMR
jgi:hypothetical protein